MFYRAQVVDNVDSENRLRVKVRVVGIHPFNNQNSIDSSKQEANFDKVPDECLPWAEQVIPPNVGKVDGGYGNCDVPDVDDWLWIFFEDDAKQKPHYFGIVSNANDKVSDYKQTKNSYKYDRWKNNVEFSEDKIEINNGAGTVSITLEKDGNIKIYSANAAGVTVDIGGGGGRSSAVNWTNLSTYLAQVELQLTTLWTAMKMHSHLGNLGYSVSPSLVEPIISLPLWTSTWLPMEANVTGVLLATRPLIESAKLQIPSYDDGLLVPPKGI